MTGLRWPSSEVVEGRGMLGHRPRRLGGDETCQSQTLSGPSPLPPEHCDRPSHDGLCPDWTGSPGEKYIEQTCMYVFESLTVLIS